MGKLKHIEKKIILFLIFLFLFLPILQDLFQFVYRRPLDGAIEEVKNPEFTFTDWFERKFQEPKEKYINQEFGFRNFLVRLHNQFCYTIYKEAYAKWVVIGKNNYLYESGYIDAYYGRDFIGEEKIKDQVNKLKFIQDTLRKLNKNLMIVITPGKASFFPEYIPDKYKTEKTRTNYEAYADNMKSIGVEYIDFSKWFDSLKNKLTYPLYPQYGVHWSTYGATLAVDSLLHNVEFFRKVDLPDIKITGYETPDTLRSPDDDLYKGMNLLLKPKSFKMGYPIFTINDSSKTKPTLLAIADSYFWSMYGPGTISTAFNNARFYFYYEEMYSDAFPTQTKGPQLNLKDEINKSDVILILSRNADIQNLGWGFIDDCYALFSKKKS